MKKYLILILTLIVVSCNMPLNEDIPANVPIFNSDSAYNFIMSQVDFGPRVPNTVAHDSCAIYLTEKMISFGAEVQVQKTKVKKYDGEILDIQNIISKFYPEKKKRILLFAHWDTRFMADESTDSILKNLPIDGANDGASGTGVLIEIARLISKNEPEIGIDFIFFDGEDQGEPSYLKIYRELSWCLGSQYWAENLDKESVDYEYGISLDMVGAEGAVFTKEDNSRHFAGYLTKRIWKIAALLGYGEYFPDRLTRGVLHDHLFVAQIGGVPSVLIIENNKNQEHGYGDYWHTENDNIGIISKETLSIVGDLLTHLIYMEDSK